MPVGDCEKAFAAAAALADGIVLERAREPWLNQRGHLGLPDAAQHAAAVLADIFAALDGLLEEQETKRMTALPGDLRHAATGTLIEVDEFQHFTTYRLIALDLYPDDVRLGFDIGQYRELCREWAPRSDRYRATKAALGFGPGGRQRQRAYHDALRDLAAPEMGRPPVIRVAAPDGDGQAAYAQARNSLCHLRLKSL